MKLLKMLNQWICGRNASRAQSVVGFEEGFQVPWVNRCQACLKEHHREAVGDAEPVDLHRCETVRLSSQNQGCLLCGNYRHQACQEQHYHAAVEADLMHLHGISIRCNWLVCAAGVVKLPL